MPWVEFQLNTSLSEQHKRSCLSKSEVLLRKFTLQGWGYILMIKHLSSTGTWALSPAKHTCMYTHTCTFYRWETRVECYDISSLKSPSSSSVILTAPRLLTTRFLHLSSDNPSTAPLPSPASAWGSLFWPIFSLSDTWTSKIPSVTSKASLEVCVHLYGSLIPLCVLWNLVFVFPASVTVPGLCLVHIRNVQVKNQSLFVSSSYRNDDLG